jgi:primosomal protein N' (replication factor Y)
VKIARVALDVPRANLFDYLQLQSPAASVGDRVVVPFGKRRRVGVVVETAGSSHWPADKLKPIVSVCDDAPPLSPEWLELMRFLSSYYQRPLGETVISALPPRLRSLKALPRKALRPEAAGKAGFVPPHTLSSGQSTAVARIVAALGGFAAFLLHGVTGSGKTEVYLHAIAQALGRGAQSLVLVPEISLTPQLEARFRHAFPGVAIAVLHSALDDTRRTAAWLAAARGEAGVVLGTRLAALAPLPRLGLVVVDEEHDASFKQQEGLRYSGRDVALVRAKRAGCPAVLGTATPALETWFNCRAGRYTLLELPQRAAPGARLPEVRAIDLRREPPEQGLAPSLRAAIGEALGRGEQSLVFINRRGYAPVLACEACGWCAGCARCTSRLVLHATDHRLRCHHCGAEHPLPRACPTCGNVDLRALGRGTQRVEETLATRFPGARIVRIDRDSARRRAELSRTLDRIRAGGADILVGTQLLAKGHDFPLLTLVGVLNADHALLSVDYRAAERLFATLEQVAGRAGRRERPGTVLVQTRYPEHALFAALARHDYAGFAEAQLEERRSAGFPPYVYQAVLRAEAERLADALAFLRGAARLAPRGAEVTVYDPVPNVITRRAGLERAQLLVQSRSRPALQAFLAAWLEALREREPRALRWYLDVDPIESD